MTKRKFDFARVFVMTLFVAVLSLALVACGPKGTTVKWDIDENATVTVEGYEGLPEKVAEETVSFTVTPKDGFVMDEVTVATTDDPAGKAIKPRSGVYTTDVVEGMTIKVTVKTELASVSVTPSKTLKYYAGEAVNKSDLVVKAVYKDKSEVTLEEKDYRIKYQGDLQEAFALGDTSFYVTYQGLTSSAVTLEKAVTGLVTLDTAGGTIPAEDLTLLETENGLKFTNSSGVYTAEFTQPIEKEISLPVTVTKDGCTFWKWTVGDAPEMKFKISASKDSPIGESATATVHWSYNFVDLTSAKLEAGADGAINLTIEGTYKTNVNDMHLALAVAKKADEIAYIDTTAYNGTANNNVTLKFKANDLLDKAASDGTRFAGSALVLQLRATVNGEQRIQEFYYNAETDAEKLQGGVVTMDEWNVQLDHKPDDSYSHAIVLAFPSQPDILTYTISSEESAEGPILKIEGEVTVKRFYGKSVYIWWSMGTKFGSSVPIGQDGKFTWTATLNDANGYKSNSIGWGHLNIHDPDASINPNDLSNSLYSYFTNGNYKMGTGTSHADSSFTVCKNADSEFTFTNDEIKAMVNAGDYEKKVNSATTTSIKFGKPLNTTGDYIYYACYYKTSGTDCLVLLPVQKDIAAKYDL